MFRFKICLFKLKYCTSFLNNPLPLCSLANLNASRHSGVVGQRSIIYTQECNRLDIFGLQGNHTSLVSNLFICGAYVRCLPRFFDQVGHQSMSAYIENKHFFTKSCHRQTYQNYEQTPQSLQNLYFQSHFST